MNIAICILAALLLGFAPGSNNKTGSLKLALLIGLLFGTLVGGACLLGGSGWLIAGCLLGASVAGSFVAAYTPNDNPIKWYFNLSSKRS